MKTDPYSGVARRVEYEVAQPYPLHLPVTSPTRALDERRLPSPQPVDRTAVTIFGILGATLLGIAAMVVGCYSMQSTAPAPPPAHTVVNIPNCTVGCFG